MAHANPLQRYNVWEAVKTDVPPGYRLDTLIRSAIESQDLAEKCIEDELRDNPSRRFVIQMVDYRPQQEAVVYTSWDDLNVESLVERSAEQGYEGGFTHGRKTLVEELLEAVRGSVDGGTGPNRYILVTSVERLAQNQLEGDMDNVSWSDHPLFKAGARALQRKLSRMWPWDRDKIAWADWRTNFFKALSAGLDDETSVEDTPEGKLGYDVGRDHARDIMAERLRNEFHGRGAPITGDLEDDIAYLCGDIDHDELMRRHEKKERKAVANNDS